jgi:hypothetical protein
VGASTFRRNSGSVLDARRLNHQSWPDTVIPSKSSTRTPSRPVKEFRTTVTAACWSATVELISPDAT